MTYQWTQEVKQYELYTPGILEEIVTVVDIVSNAECPTNCGGYCSTNNTSDCPNNYSANNYGHGGVVGCNGDNTAKYSSKCVNAYYSSVNTTQYSSLDTAQNGSFVVCPTYGGGTDPNPSIRN